MGFLSQDQKGAANDRLKSMGMGAPGDMPPMDAPPAADPLDIAMQIGDLANQLVDAMSGEEQAEGEPMATPTGDMSPPPLA